MGVSTRLAGKLDGSQGVHAQLMERGRFVHGVRFDRPAVGGPKLASDPSRPGWIESNRHHKYAGEFSTGVPVQAILKRESPSSVAGKFSASSPSTHRIGISMAYKKAFVCLANSVKTGGRCIAGKELLSAGVGYWVRPVSTRPSAEVQVNEYLFADNAIPQLLDIVEVSFSAPEPRAHQTENHVIEGNHVVHILGNGRLEEHSKSMARLKHQLNLPEDDRFALPEEVTQEAYRLQESRIAYDRNEAVAATAETGREAAG